MNRFSRSTIAFLVFLFVLISGLTRGASAQVSPADEKDAHSLCLPTGPPPDRGYEPYVGKQTTLGMNVIGGVPGYLWRRGCGPTAGGMVIGYWDANGFSLLVPGDASTQTNDVNQMIATGDGPGTHYDDYSLPLDAAPGPIEPDRSEPPPGDEHPSDCVADFMRTSWSAAGNYYGWSWFSDADNALTGYVDYVNATYGVQYQATAWNETWGAFTWEDLQSEIAAGRPMVFLVDTDADGSTDHFVTVIGWRDTNGYNEYACLDTWAPPGNIRWEPFRQIQTGTIWGVFGATFFEITGSLCLVQPTSIDFDSVAVNGYLDTTFTIKNPSGETLNGNISESCSHFSIVSGGGPFALAPDDSLVVTVRFEPTAAGERSCWVETGSELCSDVFCTGVGVLVPVCQVRPDSIDFGVVAVGNVRDTTFTITNTGGGILSGTVSASCPHYFISEGPYDLAAGDSLVVIVVYAPTSDGEHNCTVETGDLLCSDVQCTGNAVPTGVGEIPRVFALYQNHPNPFNPSTTISFTLPERGKTRLSVYNIEGSLVATLVDGTLGEGFKQVTWDGKDSHGNQVSTGVYFYRLTSGKRALTRKMVFLK
ncbi:MAG: choice-of-anchor D domain-containing protein [Candidatus Latescibacterota bacterium]|nr:MAG: choice-of-anchor D domain-containing protein [Candidatus Latescibacterota bacterium]